MAARSESVHPMNLPLCNPIHRPTTSPEPRFDRDAMGDAPAANTDVEYEVLRRPKQTARHTDHANLLPLGKCSPRSTAINSLPLDIRSVRVPSQSLNP